MPSRCHGVSLKTGNGKKVRSCSSEPRSSYNVRSHNTPVIGGYHVESKPVHISLHNVSLLSPWLVTWPWTLQASLSAAAAPRSIFYVRYQPRPGLVMSDDQAPGADHCRVPADSGVITTHHGTMGWFNWTQTAHWDTETPSAHPQQHNGPLASWERPPLDSLIFNGLMKTLIFTGWTNIW